MCASNRYIVTKLKKFSDNKNVCLLLVHHTRKQQADDCFETISGTNGLLGAADGAFILQKEKRTSSKAVLDAVGRDQQDQRLYLEFNREHCLWEFTKAENEIWKLPSDLVLESVSKIVTPEITQWSGIVIVVAAIAASPFGIFISDEAADNDSIPIFSIVAECNMELSNKLDDIENAAAADRSEITGEQANWDFVLAVFATKIAGVEDDTVQDVVVITEDKKQKLKDVFWDMHEITSRTETVTNGDTSEKIVYITITTKTKDDMISKYNFTHKQQEALNTLLEQDEVLISATQSLAISDANAQDILKSLPDSLSAERKMVIKAACSLVGKVNYFWGGKSSAIGWDSEWGKLKTVSAEGSKTTGTKRPFGLDCSGFVTWSFINSGFNASIIGHGTKGQIAKCSQISWSSTQAGDLAFYGDLSHVGIVAGKDASGNILVIHSSSGRNNVVITTNSGFGFAARPRCY